MPYGLAIDRKPESEADHFVRCLACGAYVDMRDLAQLFEHVGPLPHPPDWWAVPWPAAFCSFQSSWDITPDFVRGGRLRLSTECYGSARDGRQRRALAPSGLSRAPVIRRRWRRSIILEVHGDGRRQYGRQRRRHQQRVEIIGYVDMRDLAQLCEHMGPMSVSGAGRFTRTS